MPLFDDDSPYWQHLCVDSIEGVNSRAIKHYSLRCRFPRVDIFMAPLLVWAVLIPEGCIVTKLIHFSAAMCCCSYVKVVPAVLSTIDNRVEADAAV